MGLFDVVSSSRRDARDSADTLVVALAAAAPRDAEVSADRLDFGLQHFPRNMPSR